MAYTLGKAIEDIGKRIGSYSGYNWRLGNLVKIRFEHSPMSETPLRRWFEQVREHSGSRRTPVLYTSFYHDEGKKYLARGGSVFRMTSDLSDPNSGYFSTDVETDHSRLWSSPSYEVGMTELWEQESYFRVPTFAVVGNDSSHLEETAPKIFLYPNEVEKETSQKQSEF